jgi:hypothetical protein
MFGLRRRRPRATATTEFGAALIALRIKQRSAARWFGTSERNIRRWKSGDRHTPPAVGIVLRLLIAQKITVRDVEEAAALIPARSGSAKGEPPARLRAELGACAKTATLVEQICALTAERCHWPVGDPKSPNFFFCNAPTIEPPYCPRHRDAAHMPQPSSKTVSAHRPGFRPSVALAGSLGGREWASP